MFWNDFNKLESLIPVKVCMLYQELKPESTPSGNIINVLEKCIDHGGELKNDKSKFFYTLSLCEVYRKLNLSNRSLIVRDDAQKLFPNAFKNYLILVESDITRQTATMPSTDGYKISKDTYEMGSDPETENLVMSETPVWEKYEVLLNIDNSDGFYSYHDKEDLKESRLQDIIKKDFCAETVSDILK